MSYEIVKGLSLNLSELSATFRSSSNNVYPKSYEPFKHEFVRKERFSLELTDKEVFILLLLRDVHGGHLKLQQSVSVKTRWAFQTTLKEFESHPDVRNFSSLYYFIDNALYFSNGIATAKNIAEKFEQNFLKKDTVINKVIYLEDYDGFLSNTSYSKSKGMSLKYVSEQEFAKTFSSQKELDLLVEEFGLRFKNLTFSFVDLSIVDSQISENASLFNER